MKRKIERFDVCVRCMSVGITDPDCICTYTNGYDHIIMEFEVCECCGNLINNGEPADTEFNEQQYKIIDEKYG